MLVVFSFGDPREGCIPRISRTAGAVLLFTGVENGVSDVPGADSAGKKRLS